MHRQDICRLALAFSLAVLVGCGGQADASSTKGGDPSAKGGSAKGGPAGAVRGPPAVVLGPNDVIEIKKGAIESAIGISGDLKPIEEIAVRARVEGNILNVVAREGTRVGRGQLLARFEDATQQGDRASATADVESAKADLANAQWNADQSAELFKAGAIAERDSRTAQQTLTATQARLAAAEARLRAMSQNLQDTRIVSPTNGIVSARSVEPGEHVQRGATIFTVVRSDVLELQAAVPARNAGDVNPSQLVKFSAAGRNFDGRVARVNPTINPASRSITVYVEVPNRDGTLKGNTFATGRVIGRTVEGALLIPTSALRQAQNDDRPFVYAIANGAVDRRVVTLGIVDDEQGVAQVLDGLNEGDRVISGSIGALGNGMKVTIVTNDRQRGAGGAPGGDPSGASGRRPKGDSGAAAGRTGRAPAAGSPK